MHEFLTISQLAHGFNVSEKVIRHSFKKLLKEGRLTEGEDFIREDYRDDLHFVYKIHPARFAALTHLFPAPSPIEPLGTRTAGTATQSDSNVGSTEDDLATPPIEMATKSVTTGSISANNPATTDQNDKEKSTSYLDDYLASKDEQIALLRDQVADLKSQMSKKDGQISTHERLIESFHEGQNDARHLIKIMSERVIEMSKLQLAGATKPTDFATQFDSKEASSTAYSGSNNVERGSNFATHTAQGDETSGTHSVGQGTESHTEHENFVDAPNA